MTRGFVFRAPQFAYSAHTAPGFLLPDVELHNPWPQIAVAESLNDAWSNPLLLAWYLPFESIGPLLALPGDDIDDPNFPAFISHELDHLLLSPTTPAKDVARLSLASGLNAAMDFISMDGWEQGEADVMLKAIQESGNKLSEIARNIALSEELLATASGFCRIPDAKELEHDWIDAQTSLFGPAYSDAYDVVRHLSEIIEQAPDGDARASARELLGAFLQPASFLDGGLDTSYSEVRCEMLLNQFGKIQTVEQLIKNLEDIIPGEDLHSWQLTLAGLLHQYRADETVRGLWQIARGRRLKSPPQKLQTLLRRSSEIIADQLSTGGDGPSDSVLFGPRQWGGRWFLSPRFDEFIKYERTGGSLLLSEAIREQIDARQGFCCPYLFPLGLIPEIEEDYEPECLCRKSNPRMREHLSRLAAWAMEGRLGDGSWRPLLPPCA